MARILLAAIIIAGLLTLGAMTARAFEPDPVYWYRHPDGTCIQRIEMEAPKPPSGFVLDTTGLCGQPNEGRPDGAR